MSSEGKLGCFAVAAVVGIVVIVVLLTNIWGSTENGFVGVLRNGGPLDNRNLIQESGAPPCPDGSIRPEVLPSGASIQPVGLFTQVRQYPVTTRTWTVDADGGGDRVSPLRVQTSDGVTVDIEGQWNFTLSQDPCDLGRFDSLIGSRTFPGPDGNSHAPSEGTEEAWSGFLNAFFPNATQNAGRTVMTTLRCVDIVASCNLVQNQGAAQTAASATNPQVIGQLQGQMKDQLQRSLDAALQGHYLTIENFNLGVVKLTPDLQARVDASQAAFARVSEANAETQRAKAEADANGERQRGYNACATCAQIDLQRAQGDALAKLQPGAVFAPGQGLNLNVPAGR